MNDFEKTVEALNHRQRMVILDHTIGELAMLIERLDYRIKCQDERIERQDTELNKLRLRTKKLEESQTPLFSQPEPDFTSANTELNH
ncbi:MAG: hypothetical protein GKR90_25430 [Pseudomonadales bacterium]|nr:hypothetical protein [Pseudomonadales bacterium]